MLVSPSTPPRRFTGSRVPLVAQFDAGPVDELIEPAPCKPHPGGRFAWAPVANVSKQQCPSLARRQAGNSLSQDEAVFTGFKTVRWNHQSVPEVGFAFASLRVIRSEMSGYYFEPWPQRAR